MSQLKTNTVYAAECVAGVSPLLPSVIRFGHAAMVLMAQVQHVKIFIGGNAAFSRRI